MVLDPRIAKIDQQIIGLVAERISILRDVDPENSAVANLPANSLPKAEGSLSPVSSQTQETAEAPKPRLSDHCNASLQTALHGLSNAALVGDNPSKLVPHADLLDTANSQEKGLTNFSLSKREQVQLIEAIVPHIAGVSYQLGKKKVQIAYLGPEYSYSYSAACKFFGASEGLQAVQTIGAVFEEVIKGNSHYGVVPIENSTDGRIVDTLTKFIRTPVHICGEIHLPIHHNLLARCDRSEIKEVHSKPQALSQCRSWLTEHLPNARWVEVASTALAAKIASETPFTAAVASRDAGIALGLDIVAECIEDNKNNVTRFAVIGGNPAAPTGDDKTSLMFQVPHKPGALADVMLIFRDNHLNLSWIESFPLPGSKNEYIFFVDIEGHIENSNVRSAITAVEQLATRFNLLGSYPKGYIPEK